MIAVPLGVKSVQSGRNNLWYNAESNLRDNGGAHTRLVNLDHLLSVDRDVPDWPFQ